MMTVSSLIKSFNEPPGRSTPSEPLNALNIQDEIILETLTRASRALVEAAIKPQGSYDVRVQSNSYKHIFLSGEFALGEERTKFEDMLYSIIGRPEGPLKENDQDVSLKIGGPFDTCYFLKVLAIRANVFDNVKVPIWQAFQLIFAKKNFSQIPNGIPGQEYPC